MKKPLGLILSKDKAREICSNYHGYVGSAFYSFSSTGKYVDNMFEKYIDELKKCLEVAHSHVNLKNAKELTKLQKFFTYKRWEYLRDTKMREVLVDKYQIMLALNKDLDNVRIAKYKRCGYDIGPVFFTRIGNLTPYAFACGYIEKKINNLKEEVIFYSEHNTYQIKGYKAEKFIWRTFLDYGLARKFFKSL